MKIHSITDVGLTRGVNQDCYGNFRLNQDCSFAVICDGMGGAKGGGIASSIAKDVFSSELQKSLSSYLETGGEEGSAATVVPRYLRGAVEACNSFTYELSKRDPDLNGMGTTLACALLLLGLIFIANVGDSRVYGCSADGVTQLTKDHSFVQEMVDRGRLTEEEARQSTNRNIITRAIGVEQTVKTDTFIRRTEEFDYLLLCTDGLSNYLTCEDMHTIIYQPAELLSFERKVKCMVDLAKSRGGSDNITVTLIGLKDE